jgi:metal-sulfur cluster biosynthetic enzyme
MHDGPLQEHQELRSQIIAELNEIKDPCSLAAGTPFGLDDMGLVDQVDISEDGAVLVKLRLTSPFCHMIGFFKVEAQRRLLALPGVSEVSLEADNGLDWSPARISAGAQAHRAAHLSAMQPSDQTASG